MIAPKGVIAVVVAVFKEIGRGRRQRAKSLKALADRKFKELETTHELFVHLLKEVSEAADAAVRKSETAKDLTVAERMLINAILAVEKRRFQRIDARRKNLAEARIYSEKELSDTGIFRTVPENIARRLRDMMSAYAAYFLVSDLYSHDLGRALFEIRSSVIVLQKQNDRFSSSKRDLKKRAHDVKSITHDAISQSRTKWTNVATAYHELNFSLHEHGYI
jgi:hypothetical protein